ncbi:flagellin N-terminal helical domain-containing protein, partial [Mobiluncus mulieris]
MGYAHSEQGVTCLCVHIKSRASRGHARPVSKVLLEFTQKSCTIIFRWEFFLMFPIGAPIGVIVRQEAWRRTSSQQVAGWLQSGGLKMSLSINQNIMAMNSYRNLSVTQGGLAKSLEKLSSGFRINRAADDAAGL